MDSYKTVMSGDAILLSVAEGNNSEGEGLRFHPKAAPQLLVTNLDTFSSVECEHVVLFEQVDGCHTTSRDFHTEKFPS